MANALLSRLGTLSSLQAVGLGRGERPPPQSRLRLLNRHFLLKKRPSSTYTR